VPAVPRDPLSRSQTASQSHADFPHLAKAAALALHVELRPGDALYLPCGWWHDVRTPRGETSLSVSFWAQQPESKLAEAPLNGEDDESADGGEALSAYSAAPRGVCLVR